MRCYLANGQGIDHLTLSEKTLPTLSDNDVLISVKACCLNYRDLLIAKGKYQYKPQSAPFIPLSDMSGVVEKVGSNVTELKPGDCVLNSPFRHWPAGTLRSSWARTFIGGMGVDGVLAEQVIYPADSLVKVPDHLDFTQASAFPIAGLTAWAALVTHGKVQAGDWVLLQGTGGVSIFAAQLAHALGARTIMTTGSPEKADIVKNRFGVHATVNYHDTDWYQQVKSITPANKIDLLRVSTIAIM